MHEDDRADRGAARGGQFATFAVDGLWFGIEVPRVQEVLRSQDITRVPRAQGAVEGLINLRGQIVTAVDMRRRLGLRPRPAGSAPMNMVVRSDDGAVSLLVDEIGDVLDVDGANYEPTLDTVTACIRNLTSGMYKLEGRLLLCLDTGKALDLGAGQGRSQATGCERSQDSSTTESSKRGQA
jgi:purine-binding chemotaxis protein CheW